MSEKFPPPVELFGEDPDEFALRGAAAEGVLEQVQDYSIPGNDLEVAETPENLDRPAPTVSSAIGTREEPILRTGEEVELADGQTYIVEAVDHSGRGIIVHQKDDPGLGRVLSFNEFLAEIN